MTGKTFTTQKLGTVELASGQVLVTDPCYIDGSEHMIGNFDLPTGSYDAEIALSDEGMWGVRVAELRVRKAGTVEASRKDTDKGAGVDSGQMMIGDAVRFLEDGWDEGDFSYDMVCDVTISNKGGLVENPHGVAVAAAARSGYGDGVYPIELLLDSVGETIGIAVTFIDPNEADDE